MAGKDSTQVLFVLECGGVEADVLRTLPTLARGGVPEVLGLFVEDEDVLGAAKLPGVSEVSLTNHSTGTLNPERIAQDLARQVETVRALFEASAKKFNLRYTFRVSRGRTVETLIDAAADSDLVVVCRPLRASGLRPRPGAHFKRLIEHHRNVLFVNEPWHSGSRVVAVCDGASSGCVDALQRAGAMAKSEKLEFVVVTAGDQKSAMATAEQVGCDRQIAIDDLSQASLIDLCFSQNARLLVMRPVEEVDWQQLLVGLLDKLSCSLLLLSDGADTDV